MSVYEGITTYFIVIVVAMLPVLVRELIDYDCRNEDLNITTLLLLDVATCNMEDVEPRKEEIYLQLLRLSDFDRTEVLQCQLKIDRTIFYCEMHSHVAIMNGGRRKYVQELGADACRKLCDIESLILVSMVIDKI